MLELAGMGPGPYGAMLLADLGADVVRVDRPSDTAPDDPAADVVSRGRRSVIADLKDADGICLVRRLAAVADVLIDPFRPGVLERAGLGPAELTAINPRLVYARITGYGQEGPLAHHAGHDINYVGLGGALAHIGRRGQPPTPPLNLVGDMGAGGLLLAFGVAAALVERGSSGMGQVLDVAMVDGVASLMTMMYGYLQQGVVSEERGANVFDSGSHFYDVYECADGEYLAFGAIEPHFFRNAVQAIGLEPSDLPRRGDRTLWPEAKRIIGERIHTRARDEWCALLADEPDVCLSPVLRMSEAPRHVHLESRETFLEIGGVTHPAPVPRFSRTPGAIRHTATRPGDHTAQVLEEWVGYDPSNPDRNGETFTVKGSGPEQNRR